MRFAGSQGALDAMGIYSGYDPGGISGEAMFGRSRQRSAAMDAEAAVLGTELLADAKVQAAKYGADATRAQGEAAGQASLFSGIASGVGSLAGGLGNRFSQTPGQPFAYDAEVFGSISDPTADIQRALGDGVPFGMYPSAIR